MGSFPPPLDSSSFGRSNSRMSFFRTLIGQRNDDYRSDAPQEFLDQRAQGQSTNVDETRHRSNRASRSNRSGRWSLRHSFDNDMEEVPGSFPQRCRRCCRNVFTPSPAAMSRMSRVINSKIWHAGLLFFTVVLLFGAQVQELWVPKGGDVVFDVLFSVDFVYLFTDICMRCWVESSYFDFQICRKGDSSSSWGNCRLGSFMFWCDLISTCLLLWDISYINQRLYDASTIDLELDRTGRPVSAIASVSRCCAKEFLSLPGTSYLYSW